MGSGSDRNRAFREGEPFGEPADDRSAISEQLAKTAHYKKMYDRASALAQIGVWE